VYGDWSWVQCKNLNKFCACIFRFTANKTGRQFQREDNCISVWCARFRQLIFNHRQSLADQLKQEIDAAMALHVATVLLVQIHTLCMVHVPGRCIPQLITFLRQYVPNDHYQLLLECQGRLLFSCCLLGHSIGH
jgi:hypothetical protein